MADGYVMPAPKLMHSELPPTMGNSPKKNTKQEGKENRNHVDRET